ncbi:MAG TPA: HD-GYP domain-containing protein [Ideonella sp.]|uniref:HD-GYP domain-containing protein n=1 Tax=Ideonella sp. TaxID=1929293 RepID=UPI002C93D2A9|nr:HD-GYP domain-containing protein [Ideonella sp.]HSI49195.1 HD-GYP domain-containing protein [Ideonella sp.]
MLKIIPSHQLQLGMFLHQLTGSWMDHPFWRSKFLLRDQRDIARILEAGIAEVVIDTERGLDVPLAGEAEASAAVGAEAWATPAEEEDSPLPSPHPALDPVGPRYTDALQVSRQAMGSVMGLFDAARLGQALDAKTCLPVVEGIVDAMSRKPGALASVARLKTVDDYTYMHAVAVCALMVGLARQMGLPPAMVREAGLAGLVLDIGKAALPAELLNKPGRLSPEELALMKTHARHSHDMLKAEGGYSPAVLNACLHHHERVDGSGYPDGQAGERIGVLARMAAVCDVYDAVTSRRPYRTPWDPGDAMRQMAQAKGQFDNAVFQHFVKAVGIYPVGSLVRLQSEQLAVVLALNSSALLTPRVRVFYDIGERHRITPHVLDLAETVGKNRILGPEVPDAWRFADLEQLWLLD